jgi:hypothetical protein
MDTTSPWFKKNWIICVVFFVFIFIHILGIHIPLHQDEYKWILYGHPEILPPGTVTHPPLTEFIYTKIAPIFGEANFRAVPLSFGIINFFLLYYLVQSMFGTRVAKISVGIFTLSFYSLLATLMVDVDGAIMPFFFLLLLIGYYKWKENNFLWSRESSKWILLLFIGLLGGFLIKVSFLLAIGAIFVDFLIEKKVFQDRKKLLIYTGYTILGIIILALVLIFAKYIFPFFNLQKALIYWEHFWTSSSFLDRGWFQTLIQCIKSLLFASPFLVLVPFLLKKDEITKLRPFIAFIIFAFIFYVILFDFSIGALDKYLQLLVLPLTVFSSVIIDRTLKLKDAVKDNRTKKFLLLGIIFSVVVFSVQFLPQYVPPLYPKSEWISRVISLKWNFLYPFSGGSGPIGFYISFLVLGLSWFISFCVAAFAFFRPKYTHIAVCFLIPISLMYNIVFTEEYLFGKINGSAPTLVHNLAEFVSSHDDIKKVTVYNDTGGWDIQLTGKYRKRLYIDPKFDINDKIIGLNKFKEHYMVVDIPHIDENTLYAKFFQSCTVEYREINKKISGTIYNCTKAPDIKI